MKVFKILRLKYNRGVSIFPGEDTALPPTVNTAGEPLNDLLRQIVGKGYTQRQAWLAIRAWSYHASVDLNQNFQGVRVFCQMCVQRIPRKAPAPVPVPYWHLVALVAGAVAVALALYTWVLLDTEYNLTLWGHPWAYFLVYDERVWMGEILAVTPEQRPMYELEPYLGRIIIDHNRGTPPEERTDWFFFRSRSVVIQGRKLLFYYFYDVFAAEVYFCGLGRKATTNLYGLRKGGDDPYAPRGLWVRPGGAWGTSIYQGCWQKFWWFD